MRKQYTLSEGPTFRYNIVLYHDGKEVERIKMWAGDGFEKYIDSLEDNGYVIGYTKYEIEKAYNQYKYLYENRIEKEY
jgi:hypothetical protein